MTEPPGERSLGDIARLMLVAFGCQCPGAALALGVVAHGVTDIIVCLAALCGLAPAAEFLKVRSGETIRAEGAVAASVHPGETATEPNTLLGA